jgi:hypothetical protein
MSEKSRSRRGLIFAAELAVLATLLLGGNRGWAAAPGDAPPAKKIAPPSAEQQKPLMRSIDEVYAPEKAKTSDEKVALALKMLEDGKGQAQPAEKFVLLRRAGEIARDAGETDLMLEAVNTIVDAGFDIRPYAVKARWLKEAVEQVSKQGTPAGRDRLAAVIATCLKFAEDAVAADSAADEASDVLAAVRGPLAKAVEQAAKELRTEKDPAARARAQSELESLKSAKAAVTELQAVQAAQTRLKTAPDDPAACLAVGRWYCFDKDDWANGLKFLAKGSDPALQTLARQELEAKPVTAEEKIARGDACWDGAEKSTGKAKAALRRRADSWYEPAMPDLASGLEKWRIEKRLAQHADERPRAAPKPNEKVAKGQQIREAQRQAVRAAIKEIEAMYERTTFINNHASFALRLTQVKNLAQKLSREIEAEQGTVKPKEIVAFHQAVNDAADEVKKEMRLVVGAAVAREMADRLGRIKDRFNETPGLQDAQHKGISSPLMPAAEGRTDHTGK